MVFRLLENAFVSQMHPTQNYPWLLQKNLISIKIKETLFLWEISVEYIPIVSLHAVVLTL